LIYVFRPGAAGGAPGGAPPIHAPGAATLWSAGVQMAVFILLLGTGSSALLVVYSPPKALSAVSSERCGRCGCVPLSDSCALQMASSTHGTMLRRRLVCPDCVHGYCPDPLSLFRPLVLSRSLALTNLIQLEFNKIRGHMNIFVYKHHRRHVIWLYLMP
jgi:hypothetical protein